MAPQSTKLSQIAAAGGLYHLACCCSDLRQWSCLYMERRQAVFPTQLIFMINPIWTVCTVLHSSVLGGDFHVLYNPTGRYLLL